MRASGAIRAGRLFPPESWSPATIVRVRPGDIIPADVKLLTGALTVDQSALTGESKDADKKPGEVLSSGSVVRRGESNGVVMLTGAKTYFGRTTQLVQEARPKLHIEAVVAKIVRWLFVIVGALLGVVVVLSLIRGSPLLEMVSLMLVLLMSAVPVALPVMFTVSMAVGSKELAKRGVLVTRLSAAEDAATMDVLCVDRQDGDDYHESIGCHGPDAAGARVGIRRAVRRRARVAGSQLTMPSSPPRTIGTSSTTLPRSRRSPLHRLTRKIGERKPSSSRTASGCV
jgi:E1-E2 ATPase